MPGLDVEDVFETDSSDNEENHSKLLNSVSQLDSTQRIKPAQRKEIASEVSEYNLNKGVPIGKKLIDVRELVKVLGKKPEHGIITKKIKNVTKEFKVLPKPLEKPTEERIKREVGFGKVKKELRKWDAIVTRNALKDQIRFPLNKNSITVGKSNDFLSQFKAPTPLEVEIAKVLNQEQPKEMDSDDKEFPLTLEEMMAKRKEMAQLRARLSYSQMKAKRQSKIKSKKYHRLLKRERLKQQLKEFELLQKTDPEAALKKLAELDKTRAKERASLRHRNTGKWAKNLSVRAKYDVETRKVLAEQLKMSRELTQKVSQLNSSEDEEIPDLAPSEKIVTTENASSKEVTDNPWMLDVSKEVQDFVRDHKKFWSEKEEEINQDKSKENEKQSKEIKKNNQNELKKTEKQSKEMKEINEKKSKEKEKPYKRIKEVVSGDITQNNKTPMGSKEIQTIQESPSQKKIPLKKISPEEKKTCISINSTSGVWIVTPIKEQPILKKKTKRKAEDIDTLFDELNDKLMSKAAKKVKKIKKNIKRAEKKEKPLKEKKSEKEFDLSLKNTNIIERPDTDMGLLEGGIENDVIETVPETIKPIVDVTNNEVAPSIDPKDFIQVKAKRLNTFLPDNITGNEDAVDDEKAQQKIIEEAFEDDDVIADFNELKKQEEEKRKIEIEKSLPGWGQWGGTGIVPKKRKKRLLIINLPPRKDKVKKDMIINENENPNLKNHLVKEVPHPFKSVEAFEANIRVPIGRDWVPETVHRKFIQKQVITKLGTVIEPMSTDEIVKFEKAKRSLYQGKKKKVQNLKS